jgi:glutaredoxin-like YruB-family protein
MMNTIHVHSFNELLDLVSATGRSYLLLYKGGTEQSECARTRISGLDQKDLPAILTADVTIVRDIHERVGVDTSPSLVVFKNGQVVNVIKGCQTKSAYESILTGKEIGHSQKGKIKSAPRVTVYTTPTCSWCNTLKTYLKSHQVGYREINVAADTSAAEAMVRKSGQQGVPQTEINGQMIVGFDKPRINQLLDIK